MVKKKNNNKGDRTSTGRWERPPMSFCKVIIQEIRINSAFFRGYSLYRRLVSSMFVLTPFPRGTCTPSRVTVAFGSGAVLPKPRKKIAHVEI